MEPTGSAEDPVRESGDQTTADLPPTPVPLVGGGRRPARRSGTGPTTRLSATWTGVVVSLVLLVLLIVFLAENTQRSPVAFFGLHRSAPVAVLLLIAAVAGALVVVSVAAARLLQLRLTARRARRTRSQGRSTDRGAPVTGAAGPEPDAYVGSSRGMGSAR